MKRIRLATILLPFLLLVSCVDKDLETVSKALNDTAYAMGVLQTTVIQANAQKLISDDTTRGFLEYAVEVNKAGQQAVLVTRNINALGSTDRVNLLSILQPIIAQLAGPQSLLDKITDATLREQVKALLLLTQTALNTAQLTLAAH